MPRANLTFKIGLAGTGTLESALDLLEYLNGSSDTYWAGQRRKNGHPEPYCVKYIALGNEVWGPWQVGQMSARDCKLSLAPAILFSTLSTD